MTERIPSAKIKITTRSKRSAAQAARLMARSSDFIAEHLQIPQSESGTDINLLMQTLLNLAAQEDPDLVVVYHVQRDVTSECTPDMPHHSCGLPMDGERGHSYSEVTIVDHAKKKKQSVIRLLMSKGDQKLVVDMYSDPKRTAKAAAESRMAKILELADAGYVVHGFVRITPGSL